MISMIACMANDRVIGQNNQMPWHLPADLKFFKQTTMNYPVVMGSRTFESIGKPLPGRKNIVLTTRQNYNPDGCHVVHSVPEVLDFASGEDLFIIGGAQVYVQFMPYADRLYITKIDHTFEGDTFFPQIDATIWEIVDETKGIKDEKNPYDYRFITYERKK